MMVGLDLDLFPVLVLLLCEISWYGTDLPGDCLLMLL